MKTIKSGDSDGIRPSTPVGMLVTTGNFSFVIGLLRLFIGPAMTDREEYHCDRPRGARFAEAMRRRTSSGRAFAGMSRRAVSRMMRPSTLLNSDEQVLLLSSHSVYATCAVNISTVDQGEARQIDGQPHVGKTNT